MRGCARIFAQGDLDSTVGRSYHPVRVWKIQRLRRRVGREKDAHVGI